MHLTLDQVLIFNGLVSVGVHVWVFVRWVGKLEHKAAVMTHIRFHNGRFSRCGCATLGPEKHLLALQSERSPWLFPK